MFPTFHDEDFLKEIGDSLVNTAEVENIWNTLEVKFIIHKQMVNTHGSVGLVDEFQKWVTLESNESFRA